MPGHANTRQQLAIALNNYAITLSTQGDYLEAGRYLEEAIHTDTGNTQFQHNLVMVHLQAAQTAYQAKRFTDARTKLAEALALEPTHAQANVLLGELEYNSQHLKEAQRAWEIAIATDPTLTDVAEKLQRLKQELPVESKFERISQAYFDIRYTGDLARETGFDFRDMLLEARRQVGSDFQHWPKQKIVVLVYSAEQFRRLRQDTPEWVAGQYDGKIRVPLPGQDIDRQTVTRTLFHEYTHAIVYELAANQCPTWLNEGLAEYEGWKTQTAPWLLLRKAVMTKKVLPWSALSSQFSLTLSAEEVTLAYEQSHSVVRFLVERYGFWRIRRILKALAAHTPAEQVLATECHLSFERLETQWRKWLDDTLAQS
jgi:tetratricopeptide (TPR) repeat protein